VVATVPYDREMARDIGGYFEKLTKNARGGRRLGGSGTDFDMPDQQRDEPTVLQPEPARERSGGLGDVLKDILGKGRSTAKTTTTKARDTVANRTKQRRPTTTRKLPPEGVVTIEYAPRMDGDPDPGEVVWTWVPFEEDPSEGKDRPVVVIGRRSRSLIGVPLTTKQNDREAQISIGTGDWDPERRQSYARIWRMLDIDESKTRREGAVLERGQFDAVVAAVDEYYDIRRPASKQVDRDYDY